MMKYFLPFDSLKEDDPLTVGRKAFNLGILGKKGFSVPPGFSIPSDTGRALWENYLSSLDFYSLPPVEKKEKLSNIQSFILNYNIPAEFISELEEILKKHNFPFVVRSSCPDEDGSNYSFAGIYNSLLDLNSKEDILNAVKSVWASLWSLQAFTYKEERGIFSDPDMSVILQKQIDGKISGVIFTRNPSSPASEMLINASMGKGDDLVSGKNIPLNLVLSINDFDLTWTIKEKSGDFSLEDNLINELILNARKIEEIFGCPQDIEWAYDGKLYILQARPITYNRDIKWSKDPVSDFIPEHLTPLSGDFCEEYLDKRLVAFHEELGMKRPSEKLVLNYKGIIYINEPVYNKFFQDLYDNRLFFEYFPKIFDLFRLLPEMLEDYHSNIINLIGQNEDITDISDLLKRFLKVKTYICHHDISFNIGYIYNVFVDYYKSLIPPELLDYKDYFSKFTPTDTNIETYTFQKDIMDLSKDDHIRKYIKGLDGKVLPVKISEFIEKYGHWTETLMELSKKRYREDNSLLMATLKALISKPEQKGYGELKSGEHMKTIDFIKKKYEHSIRRIDMVNNFNYIIDAIVYLVNTREEHRKYTLLATDYMRRLSLSMADIFMKKGFLNQKEDIFYLNLTELNIISNLDKHQNEWLSYIKFKKNKFQELASLSYPYDFSGAIPKPCINTVPLSSKGNKISGLTLNKGYIEAPARVVRDTGEIDTFVPGEILVVPNSDPYWSVIFPISGGFISEMGGLLSHAGILTREYNIPAISGVPDATRIIKTGDMLILNSDEGWVEIIKSDIKRESTESVKF